MTPLSEPSPVDENHGTTRLPVGPGRHGPGAVEPDNRCPGFETDPAAWFAWLEAALATGRPIDDATRAASWTDPHGRTWRVVVAADGPEVRPAFGTSAVIVNDLPRVSAILVAPPVLHVELMWHNGQEVARLGTDEASVLDLGLAMLSGTELPHEAIRRADPDTWRRARERWARLVEAAEPERSPLS